MRDTKPEKRLTRQQSINEFCKNCTYDPYAGGTWRQQTEACTITDCFLWAYRPVSRTESPVEAH
jgi:hypothetical protein